MKAVLMAALAAQLVTTGGAGVEEQPGPQAAPAAVSWRELGKRFSALRKEISQVERDFQEARARHREAARQEEPAGAPAAAARRAPPVR